MVETKSDPWLQTLRRSGLTCAVRENRTLIASLEDWGPAFERLPHGPLGWTRTITSPHYQCGAFTI